MLEELASHGYIVVALAHDHEMIPNVIFTDGRRHWFRKAAVAGTLTVSKRPHDEDVHERGAGGDGLRVGRIHGSRPAPTWTAGCGGSLTAPPSTDRVS